MLEGLNHLAETEGKSAALVAVRRVEYGRRGGEAERRRGGQAVRRHGLEGGLVRRVMVVLLALILVACGGHRATIPPAPALPDSIESPPPDTAIISNRLRLSTFDFRLMTRDSRLATRDS